MPGPRADLGRPLAELAIKPASFEKDGKHLRDRRSAVPGYSGETADETDIEKLLGLQHYRPGYWRLSRHESNYRRFFDIVGLSA